MPSCRKFEKIEIKKENMRACMYVCLECETYKVQ